MSTLPRPKYEGNIALRTRGGDVRSTSEYFNKVLLELRDLGAKNDIEAEEMLCSGPHSSGRKLLECVLLGTSPAAAGSIFHWAQSAARLGVEWSSGPLALRMTGFSVHTLGLFGTALAPGPSVIATGLWTLIRQMTDDVFDDLQCILEPKYFRIRCFGKFGLDPDENFGEDFSDFEDIWDTAERAVVRLTLVQRKRLALSPECLDALDEAWQNWSTTYRRRDFMPEPFVRAIARLAIMHRPKDDPILVTESWEDIRLFLDAVDSRGFDYYGPRFQTWQLIKSRAITRSLEEAAVPDP
jgi:hypothetical protein